MKYLFLFDIDGTAILINQAGSHAFKEALNRLFGSLDMSGLTLKGHTDKYAYTNILLSNGFSHNTIDTSWESFSSEFSGILEHISRCYTWNEVPGFSEFCRLAGKSEDITMGYCTGNMYHGASIKIRYAGLPLFDNGTYGDQGMTKEEILRKAVFDYGAGSSEVFYFGDTEADILASHACGIKSIAIGGGSTPLDKLEDFGPFLCFEDYRPLLALPFPHIPGYPLPVDKQLP